MEAINTLISADKALFVIPDEWRKGIRQGREDIKAGKIYTLKDFEKKYEKWLNG